MTAYDLLIWTDFISNCLFFDNLDWAIILDYDDCLKETFLSDENKPKSSISIEVHKSYFRNVLISGP